MKKFIALFLFITCIFFSIITEASSFSLIHAELSSDNTSKAITADLFLSENPVIITSSLFPDQSVVFNQTYTRFFSTLSSFDFMQPILFRKAFERSIKLMTDWISIQPSETRNGRFSGELFDEASSCVTTTVLIDDLKRYLYEAINSCLQNKEETQDQSFIVSLLYQLTLIDRFASEQPLICQFSQFDGSRYMTVNVLSDSNTVMTASYDFSVPSSFRTVTAYKEQQKFRIVDTILSFSDQLSTAETNHYLSISPSYRNARKNDPVYSTFFHLKSEDKKSFEFRFESSKLVNPLIVQGEIHEDSISSKASEGENILFNMNLLFKKDSDPSYSGLISEYEKTDPYDQKKAIQIGLAIRSNLLSFIDESMKKIPEQDLNLFKLLFTEP